MSDYDVSVDDEFQEILDLMHKNYMRLYEKLTSLIGGMNESIHVEIKVISKMHKKQLDNLDLRLERLEEKIKDLEKKPESKSE